MNVIGQQAVTKKRHFLELTVVKQSIQVPPAVAIVFENVLTIVAATNHVINSTGVFYAKGSCHTRSVSLAPPEIKYIHLFKPDPIAYRTIAIPAHGQEVDLLHHWLKLIVEFRCSVEHIPVAPRPAFQLQQKLLRAIGSLDFLDLHFSNEGILFQEGFAQGIERVRIQRTQHPEFAFALGRRQYLIARHSLSGREPGLGEETIAENQCKASYSYEHELHSSTSLNFAR
jgi:hypothetical protein